MAIVIARTGDIDPRPSPMTPEQREAAWAYIIKNWADKNAASFRTLLETDGEKRPASCL